jgi:DNA-binding transcriptional ArsR family regulator
MDALRDVRTVRDPEEAVALLQRLRIRIVDLLREPDTAASVARRLDMPRQLVNYHVRQLELHGLVELLEERSQGTRTERVLRAAARSFLIAPDALGALAADPARVRDRLSAAYLLATAGKVIRDLGSVLARADAARKRVATLTLSSRVRFRSAEERASFAEELTAAVAQLVAKYHDESAAGGRRFELMVGVYPASEPAPSSSTATQESRE